MPSTEQPRGREPAARPRLIFAVCSDRHRGSRRSAAGYGGRMDHPDQVAGYVARNALGDATAPVPLAAGAWSTAYSLTVAGRDMVLRVSRHGGDFAKDEAV